MRRPSFVVAIGAALVVATGCGGGHAVDPRIFDPPVTTTVAVPATKPVAVPPGCTEGTAGTVVASSRPPASMPSPGNMPAGSFMATIAKRGKLVVGTSPDQLLFGYVNPLDGQIEGVDVDLLKAVAAAIFGTADGHIQFVTLTLAQRIPKILDGSVDIVADTMTINCARRQQVDFSVEYYDAGQTVLVRSDSTAQRIEDLGGKKVCSAASSTSLDNLAKVSTHPVPVAVPDQSDCLVQFQEGNVDAISTDDTVLAGLAAQDKYAKVLKGTFTDEPYGMAISLHHPEFTSFVNGVLERLRGGGGLDGILSFWLGSHLALRPVPPFKYKG
jgi:polar amino acid transport system substrate-binding protein